MMFWVLLLIALGALIHGAHKHTWPYYRDEFKAKREARVQKCAMEGHDFGDIFCASGRSDWPMRNCKRCPYQEHLARCPGCGKSISNGKPVADAEHPDDPEV